MSDLKMRSDGGAFWHFSLAVYRREGVEAACLGLQDDVGLDVNLLLFCLWAGSRGQSLEAGALAGLMASTGVWQAEVVAPLRRVRRWLKTQSTIDRLAADALRQAIKSRELEAEALEQQLLESQLSCPVNEPSPETAAGNLLAYLAAKSIAIDDRIKQYFIKLLSSSFENLPEKHIVALLEQDRPES
jgi:uncharacterized protein (TIGR02444 family)